MKVCFFLTQQCLYYCHCVCWWCLSLVTCSGQMARVSADDSQGSHVPTQTSLCQWQTRGCAIFHGLGAMSEPTADPALEFNVCYEHTSAAQTALTIYLWKTEGCYRQNKDSHSLVSPVLHVCVCLFIYRWLVVPSFCHLCTMIGHLKELLPHCFIICMI